MARQGRSIGDADTCDESVHPGCEAAGGISSPGSVEDPAKPAPDVWLNADRITVFLGTAIVFLITASLAGQIAKYQFGLPSLWGGVDLFYVDAEANLPTTFQGFHLLFAAALLFALGLQERRISGCHARHWFILAAGFVYLAVDESAMLHERIPLYRVMQLDGIWASMWVIPGILAVTGVAVYFRRFVLQMHWRDGLQVITAGGVFVSGSIGVEMAVSGIFDTASADWKPSYRYALLLHLEEFLEMTGILLFNRFLLHRMARLPPVSLGVRGA